MVKAKEMVIVLRNADIEKVNEALKGFDIFQMNAILIGPSSQDDVTEFHEEEAIAEKVEKPKVEEVEEKPKVEEVEIEKVFDDVDDVEKTKEKPKPEAKGKMDYNKMTIAEIRDEIERRGLDAKSVKKQPLVDALIEDDKGVTSEEIDEVDETREIVGSKYDGRKAMDLYKEAVERGLDVKPRQKATFYVEILEENDAEELAKQKDKVEEKIEEVDEEWEDILEEEDEWDI